MYNNKNIQTKYSVVNIEVKHVIHGQHEGEKSKLPAPVPECTRYFKVETDKGKKAASYLFQEVSMRLTLFLPCWCHMMSL